MGRIVYPDWFVESIAVGRVGYPDWYVESIDMRIRTFILIYIWIRSYVALRCVVSSAVFLAVAWSHLQ